MKAKKPLLLALLVVALLVGALILPATASAIPKDEGKVVYFHSLSADMPTTPVPPLWDNPGGTAHWRDWLYTGQYFVPDLDNPNPDPTVLDYLTGYVEDNVSMNQGNLRTKGTVWVGWDGLGDVPDDTAIWEFSSVGPRSDPVPAPTSYHAVGHGVAGAVKGWVLSFDVMIDWTHLPLPLATLDGYYIMK